RWREGLAKSAAVEDVNLFDVETLGSLVPRLVSGVGLIKTLLDGRGVGEDRNLHLLDERHLGLVEVHNVLEDLLKGSYASLLQVEARPHPDRVTLVQVHQAVDVGEKSVVTPLDDRLQVLLDKLACYLEDHAEGDRAPLRDLGDVGTDDRHLAVLNLVHR